MNLFMCNFCNHTMPEAAMLMAPSPFNPDETLYACPNCKQCDEGFRELCDEPGCTKDATCGWPTPDGGYRRTCAEHMP